MNPLSNRPLLLASLAIVALQLVVVIYVEPLHRLFETVPLTAQQLGVTVLASLVILVAGEIEKAHSAARPVGLKEEEDGTDA